MERIKQTIQTAKLMIFNPKSQWSTLKYKNCDHKLILQNYLLWIAFIPALAIAIRCIVNGLSLYYIIQIATVKMITIIGGAYLLSWILSILAPKFKANKDFNKSFLLVSYGLSAYCLGGVFYITGYLSNVVFFFGLYSLYVIYTGLEEMTEVSKEKATAYFLLTLLCLIAASIIIKSITGFLS